MSVAGYQEIIEGPLTTYSIVSHRIGAEVDAHAKQVVQAFKAQLQFVELATRSAAPSDAQKADLLAPLSKMIEEIQDYRNANRTSPYFNHLSAISESIPALGWVTIKPTPGPYVKEMNDAGQFYTNRVLRDWKEKSKDHVEWVSAWVDTLKQLQAYIKQHHTTGLVWSGKSVNGSVSAGGAPPPPPPLMKLEDLLANNSINDERAALFAQINTGEDITRNLKKVTKDMQTHKNQALRTGPAPFKAQTTASSVTASNVANVKTTAAPVFKRDGKKWLIEHQNKATLTVDNADLNNVVYIFKCTDTNVVVKGKINSIVMDSCKKSSVVFDSLLASVEFINCQSIQMQVMGKVPTVTIDKTDGCQIYLNDASKDVVIVSSKSSETNVLLPKSDGDYVEHAVPEQFRTTITANNTLNTMILENKS